MEKIQIILIIDDEPAAVEVLYKALTGLGDLRFATSGIQALEFLESTPVDLVLLDLSMPGLDGIATCTQIKSMHPDLPVIFVTAAHDMESELRAMEVGAIDFIQKPISPPVVKARVAAHLKLKKQDDLLRTLSKKDPLTGLANRRALDEQIDLEWRRVQRNGEALSLLMIDIDHFKLYNDHYGHIEGDACLVKVAHTLYEAASRAGDLVARFGGEEFAVLLPNTGSEHAVSVANKMCEAVRALAIPHAKSQTADRVTISAGVGTLIPQVSGDAAESPESARQAQGFQSVRTLFAQADAALYKAKQSGRNRAAVGNGLTA